MKPDPCQLEEPFRDHGALLAAPESNCAPEFSDAGTVPRPCDDAFTERLPPIAVPRFIGSFVEIEDEDVEVDSIDPALAGVDLPQRSATSNDEKVNVGESIRKTASRRTQREHELDVGDLAEPASRGLDKSPMVANDVLTGQSTIGESRIAYGLEWPDLSS